MELYEGYERWDLTEFMRNKGSDRRFYAREQLEALDYFLDERVDLMLSFMSGSWQGNILALLTFRKGGEMRYITLETSFGSCSACDWLEGCDDPYPFIEDLLKESTQQFLSLDDVERYYSDEELIRCREYYDMRDMLRLLRKYDIEQYGRMKMLWEEGPEYLVWDRERAHIPDRLRYDGDGGMLSYVTGMFPPGEVYETVLNFTDRSEGLMLFRRTGKEYYGTYLIVHVSKGSIHPSEKYTVEFTLMTDHLESVIYLLRYSSDPFISDAGRFLHIVDDNIIGGFETENLSAYRRLLTADMLWELRYWSHDGVSMDRKAYFLQYVGGSEAPIDAFMDRIRGRWDDDRKLWGKILSSHGVFRMIRKEAFVKMMVWIPRADPDYIGIRGLALAVGEYMLGGYIDLSDDCLTDMIGRMDPSDNGNEAAMAELVDEHAVICPMTIDEAIERRKGLLGRLGTRCSDP